MKTRPQCIGLLYQDPYVKDKNFILHYGDLTDPSNIIRILQEVRRNRTKN
ncbi:hypothetical protein AGMMS50268_12920 [Spirochaetia bacterium]|nr:hypothetical protein AGMMS50268_12920 [Spirochaetia bacterium]